MEKASLISGKTLRKVASITKTSLLAERQDSLLQIQLPGLSGSTYRIVDYSTFIPSPQTLEILCKLLIVLIGSARNQTWYTVFFLESKTDKIALIGALNRSWIKALTFFMRFKLGAYKNWYHLFDQTLPDKAEIERRRVYLIADEERRNIQANLAKLMAKNQVKL